MSDSNAPGVLIESRPVEGVAMLRINRPEVLNVLNLELRKALAQAFTQLDANSSV